MEVVDQQYLNNICRLCCDEARSSLPLEKMITLSHQDGSQVKFDLNYLVHVCVDLDLLDIDCDFPNNPRQICIACVSQLKTFYAFKESCKSNNSIYFMGEQLSQVQDHGLIVQDQTPPQHLELSEITSLRTTEEESLVTAMVYDDELNMVEDDDQLTIEGGHTTTLSIKRESSSLTAKKHLENTRNAHRQKLKRMTETPEEKAERRRKACIQTRLRRERLRLEQPEKYADILRRVADRKRERRKELDDDNKSQLRLKEALAARQRRSLLSEDKKEDYKARNREMARLKRMSKSINIESLKDDESCSSSVVQEEIYYIEEEQVV